MLAAVDSGAGPGAASLRPQTAALPRQPPRRSMVSASPGTAPFTAARRQRACARQAPPAGSPRGLSPRRRVTSRVPGAAEDCGGCSSGGGGGRGRRRPFGRGAARHRPPLWRGRRCGARFLCGQRLSAGRTRGSVPSALAGWRLQARGVPLPLRWGPGGSADWGFWAVQWVTYSPR